MLESVVVEIKPYVRQEPPKSVSEGNRLNSMLEKTLEFASVWDGEGSAGEEEKQNDETDVFFDAKKRKRLANETEKHSAKKQKKQKKHKKHEKHKKDEKEKKHKKHKKEKKQKKQKKSE